MGKEVADSAIQVLGGYGYIGDYHVERLWRDSKLLEIGVGEGRRWCLLPLLRMDNPMHATTVIEIV